MFVIIGAWAEFVHGERKLLMFVVAEEEGEEKRMNLEGCRDYGLSLETGNITWRFPMT